MICFLNFGGSTGSSRVGRVELQELVILISGWLGEEIQFHSPGMELGEAVWSRLRYSSFFASKTACLTNSLTLKETRCCSTSFPKMHLFNNYLSGIYYVLQSGCCYITIINSALFRLWRQIKGPNKFRYKYEVYNYRGMSTIDLWPVPLPLIYLSVLVPGLLHVHDYSFILGFLKSWVWVSNFVSFSPKMDLVFSI